MKRSIFISAFFLLLFTQHVHAQLAWTAIPFWKPIQSFALGSDGSIYVVVIGNSDSSSVYHSADSGSNWLQIFSSYFFNGITCDSNGAVVISDAGGAHLSLDAGLSWQPFGHSSIIVGAPDLYIQASQTGIYVVYLTSNLNFTSDNGVSWQTITGHALAAQNDWAGLYCGSEDRVLGIQMFCSCWERFDSGQSVPDTGAIGNCVFTDNEPPRSVVMAKDGYVYAMNGCGLVRLPPGRGKWEIYDSSDNLYRDGYIFPLTSQNPKSLIYLDSSGTYSSTDHGDSWHIIGEGLPAWYVAFDRNGIGYALSNGTLFTTANLPLSVSTPLPTSPISLNPIPCSTILTIHSSNIEQIKVYDILGTLRVDQEYREHSTDPELDVSGLSAGVYSMEVIAGGTTSFVRMVKN